MHRCMDTQHAGGCWWPGPHVTPRGAWGKDSREVPQASTRHLRQNSAGLAIRARCHLSRSAEVRGGRGGGAELVMWAPSASSSWVTVPDASDSKTRPEAQNAKSGVRPCLWGPRSFPCSALCPHGSSHRAASQSPEPWTLQNPQPECEGSSWQCLRPASEEAGSQSPWRRPSMGRGHWMLAGLRIGRGEGQGCRRNPPAQSEGP